MKKKRVFLILLLTFITSVNKLISQILDTTLIELNFGEGSDPQNLNNNNLGFYFTATDDDYRGPFGRELWFSNKIDGNTYRVKDIYPGKNSSDPESLVSISNNLFFTANDGVHGHELWISDGTDFGTKMVKDINPTASNNYNRPEYLVNLNGVLYFKANDGEHGEELWRSNGLEEGTFMVKDINPSGNGSPKDMFVFQDTLYFIADDGLNGFELWKSDGTSEGTNLIVDINQKGSSFNSSENNFLTLNNTIYFMALDNVNGRALWKTNGIASGTELVIDINAETLVGNVINNILVFEVTDNVNGNSVWRSDGTKSGTEVLKKDNASRFNSQMGFGVHYLNNNLFFVSSDADHGGELWKTDGTTAGTSLVKDINTGKGSSYIRKIHTDYVNNRLFFYAYSENEGAYSLWVSDGSTGGTFEISKMKPSNSSGMEIEFINTSGKTIFTGEDNIHGAELWVTNGTEEGTSLFADLNHSNSGIPDNFTDVNGDLFFSARGTDSGKQLFKSDGTIEGTKLVKDINKGYEFLSSKTVMKSMNGSLYFCAVTSDFGYELWKSDGTDAGTKLVKDIFVGNSSGLKGYNEYQSFTIINDKLYFSADSGYGFEPWISDGTDGGTKMIKNINTGNQYYRGSHPANFVLFKDNIYFLALDSETGSGLWKTDLEGSSAEKIMNLNRMSILKVVNNRLIIIAETSDTTYGPHDLWVSDATEQGTKHIKTFGGNIDSSIQYTTILNDELYFVATNPSTFRKALYKTNGTVEGTILLFDGSNHPTIETVDIDNILTCGDYVYFGLQDYYGSDEELWRTNGNIAKKIAGQDTEGYSRISNLKCFKENFLYINSIDPTSIYMNNGHLTNSVPLKINVNNGANFSGYDRIYDFGFSGDNIFISAYTDSGGAELYVTSFQNIDTVTPLEDNDKDGILNIYDECPNTQPQEKVTIHGCSESQLDDDNDGVSNSDDLCANTPIGVNVMATGCPLLYLDENNFKIKVTAESCKDMNNGKLEIEATDTYKYTAIINNKYYEFEENELFIDNLEPGVYEGCISAKAEVFEQCFSFQVNEGTILDVLSNVSSGKALFDIVSGTSPYQIDVNGKNVLETLLPSFEINVSNGDFVEVKTQLPCEGGYSQKMVFDDSLHIYPNPISSVFEISIPINLQEVSIDIMNLNSQVIIGETYQIEEGKVKINIENLATGIYFVKVNLDEKKIFRIIKN